MKAHIVVDLGFGDSGKGITTARLAKEARILDGISPLIVRHNGGHQAGHSVYFRRNGHYKKIDNSVNHHVFSQLGSGVFDRCHTYLPSTFTVHPQSFLTECDTLLQCVERIPNVYIDAQAMITTPWDILDNHLKETRVGHGSVGVGFGSTIERNEKHFRLHFIDLYHPKVLEAKLNSIISQYYHLNVDTNRSLIEEFLKDCDKLIRLPFVKMANQTILSAGFKTVIFEGAQGTLLDQKFGFFPNVTRSNTTIANALVLLEGKAERLDIHYVTRSYLTRHGNGFMPNEESIKLNNTDYEINKTNEWQGPLRIGRLDTELLDYSLRVNENFVTLSNIKTTRSLVITCCDQLEIDTNSLSKELKMYYLFDFIYKSYSPFLDDNLVPVPTASSEIC